MVQRQFHSEKGTNRVTNETTPNPYCYEDIRHNPLHFDNNQSATAQTVSNTQFSAVPISENQNRGKLASAMSLPTIAQTNVSQQFQNLHYPTGIHFSNGNQTKEPNDGIVSHPPPQSPPIQHSRTKVPTLFAVHHLSHLIFRLLRKIHLQTTKQPFIPPLLNILANQSFREIRNKFQIGLFLESNCFSHELKYKQEQSPLKTILIYKTQTKVPLNFHQ